MELQKELEDDNETEMMSSLGLQREKGKTGKDKVIFIYKKKKKSLFFFPQGIEPDLA